MPLSFTKRKEERIKGTRTALAVAEERGSEAQCHGLQRRKTREERKRFAYGTQRSRGSVRVLSLPFSTPQEILKRKNGLRQRGAQRVVADSASNHPTNTSHPLIERRCLYREKRRKSERHRHREKNLSPPSKGLSGGEGSNFCEAVFPSGRPSAQGLKGACLFGRV